MKRTGGSRPVIVWIDDDQDFQQVVKEWLLPRYDVAAYGSGEAFLSDLDLLQPDLILLDVNLPGPDGFSLCRRIREEARLRDVPVLFLTSRADDETFIAHLDTHAAGLLTKPIEKRRLLSMIGELVDGQRVPALPEAAR